MKFPREESDFSDGLGAGAGKKAARFIDNIDAPWLTTFLPDGTRADKRNGMLYVSRDAKPEPPVLWFPIAAAFIYRTEISIGAPEPAYYALGLPLTATGTARYRPIGPPPEVENFAYRRQIDSRNPWNPGHYPNQLHVGNGYVVRDMHNETWELGPIPDGVAYLRRVQVLDGLLWNKDAPWAAYAPTEDPTIGVSTERFQNFVGSSVVDHWVGTSLARDGGSRLWCSGRDDVTGGYNFGSIGREYLDNGLRVWVGNTKEPGFSNVYMGYDWAIGTGTSVSSGVNVISPKRGRLFALRWRARGGDEYDGIHSIWSPDHGIGWGLTQEPYLESWQRKYVQVFGGEDQHYTVRSTNADLFEGVSDHIASPIGDGKIALVMACLHNPTDEPRLAESEFWDMYKWAPYTAWKFFISDENGENWQNLPWPMDAHLGPRAATFVHNGGDDDNENAGNEDGHGNNMAGLHISNDTGRAIGAATLTAGKGSFYVCVAELGDNSYTVDQSTAALRMLSTRDYGANWTLSEPLPEALRDFASIDVGAETTRKRFGLPAVKWVPVKPYVAATEDAPEQPGELYAAVQRHDEGVVIWRTTAKFERFTRVKAWARGVRTDAMYGLRASTSNLLYVGTAANPAPMRVGYPEFDETEAP